VGTVDRSIVSHLLPIFRLFSRQHGSSSIDLAAIRGSYKAATITRVLGREHSSATAGGRGHIVRTVDERYTDAILRQSLYAQDLWMGR
jgi:hypothetical protein